jgi:hypothetical protein
MKFVLTRSLFRDAFGKIKIKNLKLVRDQATLPKTGLSLVGIVRPLGFKISNCSYLETRFSLIKNTERK